MVKGQTSDVSGSRKRPAGITIRFRRSPFAEAASTGNLTAPRGAAQRMKIVSLQNSEVPSDRRAQLDQLAEAEFGRFPLVRETAWAKPDWTFLGMEGEELTCFYHLITRVVSFEGEHKPVAGLNNLITLPAFRGRGLGSSLLLETTAFWFDSLGAEYGLLLCADALVPLYASLGWQETEASVTYAQPTGQRTWAANCMILSPTREEKLSIKRIDLCGLPW